MSNQLDQPETAPEVKGGLSTWEEIRRTADEVELKIHLASMDARDRWQEIEPRVQKLEQQMKEAGHRASRAVMTELEALWQTLQGLRDDVAKGK